MSSSGNSPHRFSGSVDTFYDPDFTADISKKMRVPEKIVIEDNRSNGFNGWDDPAIIAAKKQNSSSGADKPVWMTVPERILVMGNESHMSAREPLPELKLENSMIGMSGDYTTNNLSPVQLSTPPHTLTLNEHHFPTVGDNNGSGVHSNGPNMKAVLRKKRNIALSGLNHSSAEEILLDDSRKELTESPEFQSYFNSNNSMNDLSEESVVLRRQVKALSRRMAAIELENQNRYQREVFVYTFGVIYFIIKGLIWVQRQI